MHTRQLKSFQDPLQQILLLGPDLCGASMFNNLEERSDTLLMVEESSPSSKVDASMEVKRKRETEDAYVKAVKEMLEEWEYSITPIRLKPSLPTHLK